jgi:PAS domain S-box-containing protein
VQLANHYRPPESRIVRWGIGIGLCAAATVIRLSLIPLLQYQAPYLVHLAAVAVASWFAGVSGGVVATIASAFAVHLFILRPAEGLLISTRELPGMLVFVTICLGMVWQVSRWRLAEQRARGAEAELRALMDAVTESIFLFDPSGRILAVNSVGARRFGTTPDQLIGRDWHSLVSAEVVARRQPHHDEVYRSRKPVRFEDERAGVRFDHTFYPVYSPDGSVRAVASFSRDVTEQKRTLEGLRELTQRLTYHVNHSPLAVIEWGPDMRLIRWSGAAERLFGWTAEEVLGKRMADLRWVVEGDADKVAQVSSALESGRNLQAFSENRNYRKDGTVVSCEWYNSSLVDASGKLCSILSLVLDVTERRRLERELREHAEQLARANRLKDEFLATLSHELRTPLNAILGWSRIVATSGVSEDLQNRGLQAIARNAKAQTRLIEDVLDLSRIVTGTFRLDVRPVDVGAAIESALESIRPAAEAKEVAIDMSLETPMRVAADPGRLQQVMWNLLSNAVKFTSRGGRVEVLTRHADGQVEIEVRDTGMGISGDFLPHVFERFTQADSSSTREHGGLGLGLAIVRHIVELHGGTVRAASDGIGTGSVFVVRLPVVHPMGDGHDLFTASGDFPPAAGPSSAPRRTDIGARVVSPGIDE